ncbi:MAG: hypothetical protein ABFE08_08720 [Armatimonadia bacterium]
MSFARLAMMACCLLPLAAVARLLQPSGLSGLDWWVMLGLTVAPGVSLTLICPPLAQSTLRNVLFNSLLAIAAGVLGCYLLRTAGFEARTCAAAMAVACLGLGASALYWGRRYVPQLDRADLPLAVLTGAIVGLSYWAMAYSYESLNSWDGLWHAACGLKALAMVPPEHPVFAGATQYLYWAYNLYIAETTLLVNRSFAEVALAANMISASAMVVTCYEIARFFVSSGPWRYLATATAACGVNALGSLWLLVRILTGRHPLQAYVDGDALNALAVKYNWNNNYLNLPTLVPGGAGLGVPLLVAVIFLCCAHLNGALPRRALPTLTVILAACLLCHPVSGAAACLVVFATVLTQWALQHQTRSVVAPRFDLAIAGALGAAAAWPYMEAVSAPFQQPAFIFNLSDSPRMLKQAWDLAGPFLWAVPLLPLGIVGLWRRNGLKALMPVIPLVTLSVLAITVRLPWDNQYKFVYLQAPLVGIVAVSGLSFVRVRLLRRAAGWALLCTVMATLLVSALVLRVRYNAKPYPYVPCGREIALLPAVAPDDAAFCSYLQASTPPDSVVIEAPRGVDEHVELLNVPGIAHRTGFTATAGDWRVPSTMEWWMTGGYRDCQFREQVANRLSAGQALSDEQWSYLRDLKRPLYLLLREGNKMLRPQAAAALQADASHFKRVYVGGSLRLYQVAP